MLSLYFAFTTKMHLCLVYFIILKFIVIIQGRASLQDAEDDFDFNGPNICKRIET